MRKRRRELSSERASTSGRRSSPERPAPSWSAIPSGAALTPAAIMSLQRLAGNSAVVELIRAGN
ncbi:MAG TPA: hypothetical protein VFV02_14590, partial [Acidimicrobiales bacterium]|nr:hypothetical protein [Acidimicrobiales bacterium]